MPASISSDHPIRDLFHGLVERALCVQLGMTDQEVSRYIGNVLVDFTHRDSIFRIRDANGRALEQVGEMLFEGDLALGATSFDREREVHKHIGDYTLFWTGVYPEMLRTLRRADRPDHLLEYVEQGRKSYQIASTFQHGRYADEAPVLRQLAEQFETCMVGLNIVRQELDAYGSPEMTAVRRLLGS